jgi:outer membrane protein OmpA-like peptidoglycan-associated protein
MARKHGYDDATIWIGYADFLTTLSVLFFVLLVGVAAKNRSPAPGFISGTVTDEATGHPVSQCAGQVSQAIRAISDAKGQFTLRIDSLGAPTNVGLELQCPGYNGIHQLVTVRPDDTTSKQFALKRESAVRVDVLPGDALFRSNQSALRPEAVDTIVALGLRIKASLKFDEVVAVQGHTDDIPFPSGAGKDNWVLSGERAAAAAKVLTDETYGVGIPECQLTIMGFGPARPSERVLPTDDGTERQRKRSRNRRIEFRRLHGADITGGGCAH